MSSSGKQQTGYHQFRPPVVFADDLTGAMEVGLQSYPAWVLNRVETDFASPADITLVINTQTRSCSAEQTYQVTKEHARAIDVPKGAPLYYKIDSTMRGHIGAGIKALQEVLHSNIVIIAPALPQNGRITRHGVHYVMEDEHAVPLHETQYAREIVTQEKTSYIPDIIRYQMRESEVFDEVSPDVDNTSRLTVELITLDVVKQGWQHIARAYSSYSNNTIVVIDTVTPEDLDNIAQAIHHTHLNILPVGSAGLFRALCRTSGREQRQMPHIADWRVQFSHIPKGGKVVVLAGSLNAQTDTQIETAMTLLGEKISLLELDVSSVIADRKTVGSETKPVRAGVEPLHEQLIMSLRVARHEANWSNLSPDTIGINCANKNSREQEILRVREQILSSLRQNKHLIVRTNRARLPCSPEEENDIVSALGEIIHDDAVMEQTAILFLTGGQTAYSVTQILGASGIEIRGAIEPFIPAGVLIGGRYSGAAVVTKAGGFGSPRIIAETIQRVIGKLGN